MIYLFDSKLPENKSIVFALTHVYGIGKSNALLICKKLGFLHNLNIKHLSKKQVQKLVKIIESLDIPLSSDLKKSKLINAKKLISIKSRKGLRKSQGLPVRGQRTHTNAKTAKKRK